MSRRHLLPVAIALAALCTAGLGPPVLTDSDLAHRVVTPDQLRAWRDTSCPEVTADAALLVNTTTGQILCAKNEHERRAPASFVKIAAALVATRNARLDDRITIQHSDLSTPSMIRLLTGDEYSLHQLLVALLLPSDNAASLAIARHVAGNVPTFVDWMNQLAAELGLQNTHFANPHGLDDPDGYMSAYDAAILASYAMTDPTFADLVGRSEALIGYYLWPSTNTLFKEYPGVKGIKTGTTDEAGQCFVGLVERPRGRVLTVVMGSQDRWADTKQLLNFFYAAYAEVRVELPPNDLNRYLDEEGNWHPLYLKEPMTLLANPADLPSVSTFRRLDNPTTSPTPDEPVGSLMVWRDGLLWVEVPMYAR